MQPDAIASSVAASKSRHHFPTTKRHFANAFRDFRNGIVTNLNGSFATMVDVKQLCCGGVALTDFAPTPVVSSTTKRSATATQFSGHPTTHFYTNAGHHHFGACSVYVTGNGDVVVSVADPMRSLSAPAAATRRLEDAKKLIVSNGAQGRRAPQTPTGVNPPSSHRGSSASLSRYAMTTGPPKFPSVESIGNLANPAKPFKGYAPSKQPPGYYNSPVYAAPARPFPTIFSGSSLHRMLDGTTAVAAVGVPSSLHRPVLTASTGAPTPLKPRSAQGNHHSTRAPPPPPLIHAGIPPPPRSPSTHDVTPGSGLLPPPGADGHFPLAPVPPGATLDDDEASAAAGAVAVVPPDSPHSGRFLIFADVSDSSVKGGRGSNESPRAPLPAHFPHTASATSPTLAFSFSRDNIRDVDILGGTSLRVDLRDGRQFLFAFPASASVVEFNEAIQRSTRACPVRGGAPRVNRSTSSSTPENKGRADADGAGRRPSAVSHRRPPAGVPPSVTAEEAGVVFTASTLARRLPCPRAFAEAMLRAVMAKLPPLLGPSEVVVPVSCESSTPAGADATAVLALTDAAALPTAAGSPTGRQSSGFPSVPPSATRPAMEPPGVFASASGIGGSAPPLPHFHLPVGLRTPVTIVAAGSNGPVTVQPDDTLSRPPSSLDSGTSSNQTSPTATSFLFDQNREFVRMGVNATNFRVSAANSNWQLCPSYPRAVIVPKCISDEQLSVEAASRTQGRFQAMTFFHRTTQAALFRCSQPKRSHFLKLVASQSSAVDLLATQLTTAIQHTSPLDEQVLILDLRPFLAACGNVIGRGGGFEPGGAGVDVVFCDVENIHAVRQAHLDIFKWLATERKLLSETTAARRHHLHFGPRPIEVDLIAASSSSSLAAAALGDDLVTGPIQVPQDDPAASASVRAVLPDAGQNGDGTLTFPADGLEIAPRGTTRATTQFTPPRSPSWLSKWTDAVTGGVAWVQEKTSTTFGANTNATECTLPASKGVANRLSASLKIDAVPRGCGHRAVNLVGDRQMPSRRVLAVTPWLQLVASLLRASLIAAKALTADLRRRGCGGEERTADLDATFDVVCRPGEKRAPSAAVARVLELTADTPHAAPPALSSRPLPRSRNVIIHCSDGWDRTSQVAAITEVLVDPYFRTIEGFCTLCEKEFVHFGHMLRSRGGGLGHQQQRATASPPRESDDDEEEAEVGKEETGNGAAEKTTAPADPDDSENDAQDDANVENCCDDEDTSMSSDPSGTNNTAAARDRGARKMQGPPNDPGSSSTSDQQAPIFLQFLDAVRQLVTNHPNAFEFTDEFLILLADVQCSGLFAEFRCNSVRELCEWLSSNTAAGLNGGQSASPFSGAQRPPAVSAATATDALNASPHAMQLTARAMATPSPPLSPTVLPLAFKEVADRLRISSKAAIATTSDPQHHLRSGSPSDPPVSGDASGHHPTAIWTSPYHRRLRIGRCEGHRRPAGAASSSSCTASPNRGLREEGSGVSAAAATLAHTLMSLASLDDLILGEERPEKDDEATSIVAAGVSRPPMALHITLWESYFLRYDPALKMDLEGIVEQASFFMGLGASPVAVPPAVPRSAPNDVVAAAEFSSAPRLVVSYASEANALTTSELPTVVEALLKKDIAKHLPGIELRFDISGPGDGAASLHGSGGHRGSFAAGALNLNPSLLRSASQNSTPSGPTTPGAALAESRQRVQSLTLPPRGSSFPNVFSSSNLLDSNSLGTVPPATSTNGRPPSSAQVVPPSLIPAAVLVDGATPPVVSGGNSGVGAAVPVDPVAAFQQSNIDFGEC